jgi:hypothetical protein
MPPFLPPLQTWVWWIVCTSYVSSGAGPPMMILANRPGMSQWLGDGQGGFQAAKRDSGGQSHPTRATFPHLMKCGAHQDS